MAFFNYIVSLSIRACVFVPLVIAIRYLIAKFPKKYSYALWLMVFAGLVVKISVPGTIDTPISQAQHTMQQQYNSVLCSYTEDITVHNDNTEEYSRALQQGIKPIISEEAKYVITSAEGIAPPETVESSVMPAVMLIWFGGVLVLLLLYVKNVVNILSMLRFAVHYKYDIYYSEYVNSPFVFGIIKPKIYLPCSITKRQAEAVIRHERVHIKRLDYLVKPLCFFIAVLHWFNPFVWVAFYLMCRDMEHSCDEAVIKYSDIQDKKEYCDALLQFALKDKDYRIGTVMFGESDCSSRIKNVLGFKNPKRIVSALLMIIVAVVAVLAVTEEKQTEQPANQFAEMTFAQLEEYKKGELLQSDNDLNERLQILQAMDKRQDSEIADYIANEIAEYCKKDNFVKFKDVTVTQDNLTLVYNEAQKPLCNSEIKISLELYPYTDADIKAQAENYCKELYRYLCGEYSGEQFVPNLDFVAYKTKQFAVEVYSEKGEHIASYEADENNGFENPQLLQKSTAKIQNLPEIEQNALDKAFDYGKSHNNFILKKFGIDSDNRLYLEYAFSDDWLLMGDGTAEEKIAAKTAQLNDIYADITEKVINHKDVQQYIAENNVGTSVVAFSHRFLENEIVKFNLIVNKEAPHFTHDFETEDSLPMETADKGAKFVWPVDMTKTFISRGFAGPYPAHDGVDIAGKLGTEIYAAADGTVNMCAETTDINGNYIVLLHDDGYRTLYAHCDKLLVETDQKVQKGQLIATMGSTGNATGNHLHFGISKDFEYINPDEFLTSYYIDDKCERCGGQMMVLNESFGNWLSAGQEYCTHGYLFGTDLILERGYVKTTLCRECEFGDVQLVTETKPECHGY